MLQRSRHLWTALVMLVMALAQFTGLEHLCLCGSCAVSKILTGAEPEHACCAQLRQAAGWHDESSCDCGDHSARHLDAELRSDHSGPAVAALITELPQPVAQTWGPLTGQQQLLRARAPPDPGTPTYLLTLSLRI
ncbi:MAG: hypothetical protein HY902_05835 [Deltaproteobacteria bacterium]|nr:hypothetical protein [Deltaproteobacteria bacterium]